MVGHMVHVVLWLCIAACVSTLVGLGVVLTARSQLRGTWYTFFVAVIALVSSALVIYAWQYVCFVYLSTSSPALDLALFIGTVATYSALVVLVPVTSLRARKVTIRRNDWIALVGLAVTLASASVFGGHIDIPILRRFVLASRYALLAAAFFWSYGTSFAAGGASSAPFFTKFSLLSGVAFSVITVDAVFVRFSLSSTDYIPDGVISLLMYGVAVGIAVPRFASRKLRAGRSNRVSESFLIQFGITRREGEIINCLLSGSTNNEIGERLYISPRTVDTHFSNIYRKCGVRSRLELVRLISEES